MDKVVIVGGGGGVKCKVPLLPLKNIVFRNISSSTVSNSLSCFQQSIYNYRLPI